MEQLNKLEISMLIQLLDELKEQQGNAGCNDLFLEKTPTNIEFMEFFNTQVEEHDQLYMGPKYIGGNDMSLTYYFLDKLKKML